MKITFLIHHVYGIGGTIRTTLNLATALADRHDVTIVSMLRRRTQPRFTIDPRVRVVPLVDLREGSADTADPLLHQPAEVFPAAEKRYQQYSRLTDQRAEEYLRACDADVIIGTRPGINVYLARFAPPGALRIGQEHLTHDTHAKKLRAQLARSYRDLDALVTTTEADAAVYRAKMSLPGVRVLAIPNGVPDPGLPPSDTGTGAKVIAAAGRLVRGKRFDLLVDAFSDVAAKHPDWTLRIYGAGTEKDRLQQRIDELHLSGRAELMGAVSPIEAEFAKASIVASASDAESFGMTLVEAMRCGVPVVSTDCPLGPAEIIHNGVDGRLVPKGDRQALAGALLDLVADEPARRRMGQAARESSHRYDPARIVDAYEALFTDLTATRRARAWARRRAKWRERAERWQRRLRAWPRPAGAPASR
ncbi:glycosyltransferase family 4 protein [Streptomyces sp. V3I7]|uniref:glycosyltransferase family 4 protein n=1 Tax=Streptomyces sp. V3I7 TaxID=3042278 RepID=UPI00277DA381|nr:glycosyltransferase family 4 protein [Streptomyces sp. V3I7]MDQ0993567.1 glycosyltransferase involved in cell wall biosynthesis [Streptomyces sp. V3I7]